MTSLADAFIELRPDTSGFSTELRGQLAKVKEDVAVAAKLDTSKFKPAFDRIKLDLKSITATKATIDADAASASAKIKALKVELAGLDQQVKIGGEPSAELLASIVTVKAEIASLGETKANLNVDASAAYANIKALRARLAVLGASETDHTVDVKVTGTNFAIRGVSNLSTAIVALGPIAVPVLATVTAGVGVLGSALMSAGGAAGVFGLAVGGQVALIKEAQEAIKASGKLVNTASQAEIGYQIALDGTKKGTEEYRSALDALNAAQDKTAEYQRRLRVEQQNFNKQFGPAAKGIDDVKAAFDRFLKETRSVTIGVMGDSLDVVAGILPRLVPLANKTGAAVGGLVDEFARFAESDRFEGILRFFERTGPVAVTSFGHIVGDFALGFFELFKAFAPFQKSALEGFEGMAESFREWATHLSETDGFKDFMGYVQEVLPDVVEMFSQLGEFVGRFLVALGPLGGIELKLLTDLLKGLNSLPPGVLTGIAVGITAIVLGLKAWELGTKAVTVVTGIQTAALKAYGLATAGATTQTTALGKAARLASGAAGLGLLIDSTDEADTKMGLLKGAAGGALLGFSVGGPWGAAIGAGVGGLVGLGKAFVNVGDEADNAKPDVGAFIGTLNELTGAATRATRELAARTLEKSGLLELGASFGLKGSTLVDAIVGTPADMAAAQARLDHLLDRVNAPVERLEARLAAAREAIDPANGPATDEQIDRVSDLSQRYDAMVESTQGARDGIEKLSGALDANRDELKDNVAEQRRLTEATRGGVVNAKDYRAALEAFPKEAKTAFKQEGMEISLGKIDSLTEKYKGIDKKEFSSLIQALGIDKAEFDIDRFVEGANTSLGRINDEPVNVKLTTAATNVMGQVIDILDPFEFGGKVSGGIPGKDSVRAILTPDEHVWTVDEVAGAGGHATVAALRRMAKRGELGRHGDLTPFAEGGPVLAAGSTGLGAAIGTITGLFGRVASALTSALSDKLSKALVHMPTAGQLGPGGTLTPAQLVRGQTFAKGEVGKPYIWGGVGPAGYDCSGFQSATLNAARGVNPYQRLGSTGTMPWGGSSPGVGRYTMGWSTNVGGTGIGHTAGNIGGLNVESYGGHGPAVGSGARGPLDSMFYGLMHYDSGGILGPGYTMAFNGTGKNETIRTGDQEQKINDAFNAIVEGIGKSGTVTRAVQEAAKSLKGLQKAADKAEAHLQRSEDHLSGLLSAERDLSRSIAQGFDTTAFGEGAPSTARDLMQQARAEVNDAELFEHVLKQLKAHGANPGLLKALASAGPGALVQAQALAGLSRKELNRYQHVLAAGNRAQRGLGNFVGDEVYDDRVQEARKDVRHLTRALDELKDRLKRQAKDTGDEVANALDHTAVRLDGRLVGELLTRRQDRRNRGG